MTTLREAAQQALEALEIGYACAEAEAAQYHAAMAGYRPHRHAQMDADVQKIAQAITAIKAALEQPEQTNPWRDAVDHELSTLHMVASDDPRESIRRLIDWHCAVQIDPLVSSAAQELIERGKREALEPVQEPVAWLESPYGSIRMNTTMRFQFPPQSLKWKIPLYTHPPRREWRGLKEEEIVAIFLLAPTQPAFARAIEAALKERNA
jgi:hypothetical protein